MSRRVPSLKKIRTLIGYEATMSLPRILTEVAEFHRAQVRRHE